MFYVIMFTYAALNLEECEICQQACKSVTKMIGIVKYAYLQK